MPSEEFAWQGGNPVSDVWVNTAKVRGTGEDMKALSSDTQRRMQHALDSTDDVYRDHMFWECGDTLLVCRDTWRDHMVELAKKMGDLGQRLQDSADSYDAADQDAVARLRSAMTDLGRH
ncbi:type VII secretion target [Streptomyces sp. NPDC056149]|uniref:type VII secretion target n=1 Tax=unclassified Streptomyces TaxID=2593676 RepID=UPI002381656E|nr:type VII secretion target [Streptomyces sp. WZ-12]